MELLFIMVIAVFLGFELINKVPSTLHTPLMSGSNAISGITLIGALVLLDNASKDNIFVMILAMGAVIFASINVFGGYMVTDRMLKMFKSKKGDKNE